VPRVWASLIQFYILNNMSYFSSSRRCRVLHRTSGSVDPKIRPFSHFPIDFLSPLLCSDRHVATSTDSDSDTRTMRADHALLEPMNRHHLVFNSVMYVCCKYIAS
jgi:hypothetical protein